MALLVVLRLLKVVVTITKIQDLFKMPMIEQWVCKLEERLNMLTVELSLLLSIFTLTVQQTLTAILVKTV